ncbi:MAG TPA: vWA domain-containing protein [Polyangiales bacterium]
MHRLSLLFIALGLLTAVGCSDSASEKRSGSASAASDATSKGSAASPSGSLGSGTSGAATGAAGTAASAPMPGAPTLGASAGTAGSGAAAGASAHAYADADGGVAHDAAEPPPIPSGVLTAGTWDDNLNYQRFAAYRKAHPKSELAGLLPIDDQEFDDAHAAHAQSTTAHTKLDVALVIDTTGSMGDEIAYLQREFIALSSSIHRAYPNAEQRWALVAYRDDGDEYVTRWFDFRTDAAAFNAKLAEQSAGGGGDYPESPDKAFETMNQLGWRKDASVARLAFWVADAPHHDARAAALADALRGAQGSEIHVYPVASSGVDTLTELTMRSAAQLTQGRYLFLTSDSGIGGEHKEPELPCYFVTSLTDAISRMVDVELSGKYHEPSAAQVLRSAGDPQDQACELASGTAQAF